MRALALATVLLAATPVLAGLTAEQEKQLADATYVYVQSERKSGEWSKPAEIWFSMQATWPSLSPSNLPAQAISLTPSSLALASAPSRILTKKGLVFVLVIRPMIVSAAKAGALVRA